MKSGAAELHKAVRKSLASFGPYKEMSVSTFLAQLEHAHQLLNDTLDEGIAALRTKGAE